MTKGQKEACLGLSGCSETEGGEERRGLHVRKENTESLCATSQGSAALVHMWCPSCPWLFPKVKTPSKRVTRGQRFSGQEEILGLLRLEEADWGEAMERMKWGGDGWSPWNPQVTRMQFSYLVLFSSLCICLLPLQDGPTRVLRTREANREARERKWRKDVASSSGFSLPPEHSHSGDHQSPSQHFREPSPWEEF